MAVHTSRRLTADEFFALPGEHKHTELIDGEIVVNTPNTRHQRIVTWLATRLTIFSESHPELGFAAVELDVPISDDTVFAPDLWWATPERAPGPTRFEGPPDIAIEVQSPSTRLGEIDGKRGGYDSIGVREFWLIDPTTDTVTVHRRSDPDGPSFDVITTHRPGDELTSDVLPGLAIDVAALFDR